MTRPKLGFSLETLTGQTAAEEAASQHAGAGAATGAGQDTSKTPKQAPRPEVPAPAPDVGASQSPPTRIAPPEGITRGFPHHKPQKPTGAPGRPAREPYDRIHVNVALSLIEFTNARWRNYTLRNGKLAANRNEYIEDLIARDRERAIALNEQTRKTG